MLFTISRLCQDGVSGEGVKVAEKVGRDGKSICLRINPPTYYHFPICDCSDIGEVLGVIRDWLTDGLGDGRLVEGGSIAITLGMVSGGVSEAQEIIESFSCSESSMGW